MQFFNIGFGEILFIIILAIIVLGPERIVSYSRQAGKIIKQIVSSPFWREMMKTQAEIRRLPQQLISESGLEKDIDEIRREMQSIGPSIQSEIKQLDVELEPQPQPIESEEKKPGSS